MQGSEVVQGKPIKYSLSTKNLWYVTLLDRILTEFLGSKQALERAVSTEAALK